MFGFSSAPSLKSLRMLRFVAAGAFSLVVPSCLGVLELDPYNDVSDELCSLYERCYGADAFVGCRRHVTGQLETADADTRADFLDEVADCLDDCQHVRNCLDQPLLCRALRTECATSAQCCGFSGGSATCLQQSCCLVKDAPCTRNADCCAGTCANGKCNGSVGPVCAPMGAACAVTPDCCSGVCTAGICSKACSAQGTACTNNADCCSGICIGSVCTNPCAVRGDACTINTDCCANKCSNGTCRKLGCFAAGGLCLSDADCCQDSCDKGRGICGASGCYTAGIACSEDGECCNGLLCNPMDNRCAALSCKTINNSCTADADCCSLYCTNNACQCAPVGTACTPAQAYKCCSGVCEAGACVDCRVAGTSCTANRQCCSGTCNNGTCCSSTCSHGPCEVGEALSINDCTTKDMGTAAASCVTVVCTADPTCCCDTWGQSCVDKVASLCNLVCP